MAGPRGDRPSSSSVHCSLPATATVPARGRERGSDGSDVLGLFTLAAGRDVELDPLTLLEGAVARSLNRGEVNEDVVGAFTRDEAEALLCVEPLHGACCHCVAPCACAWNRWPTAGSAEMAARHPELWSEEAQQ